MVFYRKYRPQKIEELDSGNIRDLLSSALLSRDVAHAFLFTGPKGLGKTSAARIVAKAVNCLAKRDLASPDEQVKSQSFDKAQDKKSKVKSSEGVEPCNECHQCVSITNGTNIDVLEIDGASNRGIDEIRDLREKARLAPASSSKKVYIIDEVHMLTTEAFNALLKTLEEPPNHVIFVLCTTEPHKVLPTIVSRCFHIPFKKATKEELVRSFERIVKKEKLRVDKEALDFVATLSDGSFRDGAKILEEMANFDKEITKELIQKKYQILNIKSQIDEMVRCFSEKDIKRGLRLASELVEQGVDLKYFIEQLISELHEILLAEVGAIEKSKIKNQKSKMNIGEIKELVELLSRAYGELKYAVLPQLPLELVIVEWGVQKTQNQVRLGQNTQIASESANQKVRISDDPKTRHSDPQSFPSIPTASDTVPKDNFWQELINKVKSYNHSVAGVLRGCALKSYDNKKIVIETGYKFHKERLEEKKTMEVLRKACKEISGDSVTIEVILKE